MNVLPIRTEAEVSMIRSLHAQLNLPYESLIGV
jgi:hypothetical protein